MVIPMGDAQSVQDLSVVLGDLAQCQAIALPQFLCHLLGYFVEKCFVYHETTPFFIIFMITVIQLHIMENADHEECGP